MDNDDNTTRIVVVGCGLAGLAVSVGMVRKNPKCRVDIVEKRQDLEQKQGATFGLAPAGQAALQEMAPGALDYLKQVGIYMPASGGYMLPWWEVRKALLEQAKRLTPQITIHTGLELESMDEESNEDHVKLSFCNSSLSLKAQAVIGADGVHSKVRSLLGLDPAVGTGAWIWRGRVSVLQQENNVLEPLLSKLDIATMYSFGPTVVALFNFHSKLPGTIAWVVSTKSNDETLAATPMDALMLNENCNEKQKKDIDMLKQAFQQSEPHDLEHKTQLAIVPLQDDHNNRWGGRGRVTLIGDAAHAIRPASGLGGSLAMEDAVVLAKLVASCTNGNFQETLHEFESRRKPRCQLLQKDQTLRSESAYQTNKVPPWTKEFVEWLDMGHKAPDWPPDKEIYQTQQQEGS